MGVVFTLGILTGWMLWRPKPAPQAAPQPAIHQTDGSTVLEVKPDAHAKPPHQIPHGGTVEDVVHVTVQPLPAVDPVSPLPSSSGASVPSDPARPPCPPVTVDLSLIRMEDGTRRVVASSPDGQIVGAVHIPVEAAKPQPKVLKWSAGPSWNPADRTYGAWVERDLGPMRLGVDLHQVREPLAAGGRVSWAGMLRAGVRW